MTEIDINAMSLPELREWQAKFARAIATYEERRKRETLAEIEEIARERGFSLAELTALATVRRRGGSGRAAAKASVTYANPANPAETWAGKGRRPRWFKEAIEAGRDPESMRV